jgi:3-deoxy-D-manno-octulosonic-acid transferase
MLIGYSLALLLVLVAGAPWWLLRMATSGKYREGLGERLGRVPARIRAWLTGVPVIWVHAVSVGEVLAASRLIEELSQRLPDWQIVVSTTTRTGQKLARERFGAHRVFYFPLDFAFAVRAWLRVLRPQLLILAETEFWPRMLAECRRTGVLVAVVNARISDRSWPRYRRLARLWRPILRGFSAVQAQTELDAERLRALGVQNVRVGGNLKFDIRATRAAAVTERLREHLPPDARVLVCGSTLDGEEEMLVESRPGGGVTILAPRHPERFDAVAQLLRHRGVLWVRRTEWMQAPAPLHPGTIFLLDSVGELASVYSLAEVAFIGGSLVAAGGHNPLEPAQFGVPVLMGESYENFRGIVDVLRAADAIRIVRREDLKSVLAAMFADPASGRAMGERGRHVFEREAGATARAVDAILEILAVRV